jgi:exopolysaccharide biosynthesis protein
MLKKAGFFVGILVFFFFFGSLQAWVFIEKRGDWKEIAPGIEYNVFSISAEKGLVDIHSLRINPKKVKIRVLNSPDYRQKRSTVKELAQKSGAIAVINGGFFDTEDNHLGLLIRDGETVSRYLKRDWGIFMIKNDKPFIIHSADFIMSGDITQAVQVGPRLIAGRKIPKLKKQFSRRSAVGIDKKGYLVLLVSGNSSETGILDLTELAQFMEIPRRRGGLGCSYALNLDGGASTQLYVKTENFSLDLPGLSAVTNGIGVFQKE